MWLRICNKVNFVVSGIDNCWKCSTQFDVCQQNLILYRKFICRYIHTYRQYLIVAIYNCRYVVICLCRNSVWGHVRLSVCLSAWQSFRVDFFCFSFLFVVSFQIFVLILIVCEIKCILSVPLCLPSKLVRVCLFCRLIFFHNVDSVWDVVSEYLISCLFKSFEVSSCLSMSSSVLSVVALRSFFLLLSA